MNRLSIVNLSISSAALPHDVRKRSAFPSLSLLKISGLRFEASERSPERNKAYREMEKNFRLSSGEAAMLLFSRTFLPVVAVAVILCSVIYAQKRVTLITVVDMQEKPIDLVRLITIDAPYGGTTNSDGQFSIILAPETPLDIEVELLIADAPKNKSFVFIIPWNNRVRMARAVKVVLSEKGSPLLLIDPRALKALVSVISRTEASLGLGREAGLAQASLVFELPKDAIVRAIQPLEDKFKVAYNDFTAKNYSKASVGFAEAGGIRNAYYFQGRSLLEERKCREAAVAFREALKLREDDPNALNDLALSLKCAGEDDEAEKFLKRSLEITMKTRGKNDLEVAVMSNNLASVYEKQRKYAEAEFLYKLALDIQEKMQGKDHPSVAQTLHNLAGIYKAQGKWDKAEPLYKRAIEIFERAHSKDHPVLAIMLENYSYILRKLSRTQEAIGIEVRAARIKVKNKQRDSGN